MAVNNANLQAAREIGDDEFYTRIEDIENELKHYRNHFKGKTILCNCDDPRESNFYKYLKLNFEKLGLKKIISTCYKNQNADLFSARTAEKAVWIEYTGNNLSKVRQLKGDGDFRSLECIDLLKKADIVITNPPFSLFREYIAQLVKYNKKFIIVGPDNAITYKKVFPLIRDNKIWLGTTSVKKFLQPDGSFKTFGNIGWFTNLEHKKRNEELTLTKKYKESEYPKYDNYDAIEVSHVKDIPKNYDGIMGVPINFLNKFNPNQFEIVGSNRGVDQDPSRVYGRGSFINGKEVFKRLFIRNKQI